MKATIKTALAVAGAGGDGGDGGHLSATPLRGRTHPLPGSHVVTRPHSGCRATREGGNISSISSISSAPLAEVKTRPEPSNPSDPSDPPAVRSQCGRPVPEVGRCFECDTAA